MSIRRYFFMIIALISVKNYAMEVGSLDQPLADQAQKEQIIQHYFSFEEYTNLMELISKINPLAYKRITVCFLTFDQTILHEVEQGQEKVLTPSDDDDFYPELYLKSTHDLSEKEQIDYLTPYLNEYNIAYDQYLTRFHFPQEEYEGYMELIKNDNPTAYKNLRECEKLRLEPCLEKGSVTKITPPSFKTFDYPIIVLDPTKPFDLKALTKDYKQNIPRLTNEERAEHVMTIISIISPELAEEIRAVDPTATEHIVYESSPLNAYCYGSPETGLPLLSINDMVFELPFEEQYALIAHELGHYFLGHETPPIQTHRIMKDSGFTTHEYAPGKKVGGQLPLNEALSNAYIRITENEADRFSILKARANIDAAISFMQKIAAGAEKLEHPEKVTFTQEHPLEETRIQHFENLRAEAELEKIHHPERQPIDVKKVIQDYKKTN